jgi:hypothetical protein
MRTDEVMKRHPIKLCNGEPHHVWIDERGDMHLEDHDLEMLQAFTAFGAKKPRCLEVWEKWEKYRGSIGDVRLGATAFFWDYPSYKLSLLEDKWREALKRARRKNNVPTIEAQYRGYTLRRFPTTDPEVLFLGQLTGSERCVNGQNEEAMWHGVESPDGAIYVIENGKGEIVAETWAWRHGDVVLFEKVAGPFDHPKSKKDRDIVFRLLRKGGEAMLAADRTLKEVRVGKILGRDVMQLLQGVALIPPEAPLGHDIVPPPFDAIVTYGISGLLSAQEQYILARRGSGSTYFTTVRFKNKLASVIKKTLKNQPLTGWRDSPALDTLGYYAARTPVPVAVVVTDRKEVHTPASVGIAEKHELRVGDKTIAKWAPCTLGYYSDVYGNDWDWLECEGNVDPSDEVKRFLEEAVPEYASPRCPDEPTGLEARGLPYMIETGVYSVWIYDLHLTYIGSFEEEGDAFDAAAFIDDVLRLNGSRGRVEVYQLGNWIDPETEYWYPADIANWEQIA